jgi:hypothetical protein
MTMGLKFANNAYGALSLGINTTSTVITLNSGEGARFPALTAGDYFFATLINPTGFLEIVKCTARTGDSLTVVRAQDGSSANSFAVGDRLELRPVAAVFTEVQASVDAAVAQTQSKIEADDYAAEAQGGTIKLRLAGSDLYISTNGSNP